MDVSTSTRPDVAAPCPLGSDRFRRLARAMHVPAQDVDDVVQEAWLRILEKRACIEQARDAAAYVDAIVRNQARTSLRRSRRHQEVVAPLQDEDPSDDRPGPEASVIARQRASVLWRFIASHYVTRAHRRYEVLVASAGHLRQDHASAPLEQIEARRALHDLRRLDPRFRAVLVLKAQGDTIAEIAAAFGHNQSTVSSRLRLGRLWFRRARLRWRRLRGCEVGHRLLSDVDSPCARTPAPGETRAPSKTSLALDPAALERAGEHAGHRRPTSEPQ